MWWKAEPMESAQTHSRPSGRTFRSWFGDLSIKRKLILIMMVISTVCLTIACAAFVVIELGSFRQTMVRDLNTLTDIVGHNCAASLIFRDKADAGENLWTLAAKESVTSAWLFTAEEAILAQYQRRPSDDSPHPVPSGAAFHRFEGDRLVIFRPITLNDREIGGLLLHSDLKGMQAILNRNMLIFAGILMASFLLSYLLSSRLQRFIADPVLGLSRAAQAVSREKNYALRVDRLGRDEMGSLYDAFNEMLEEILQRDNELILAKHRAEASTAEAEDLLATMEQINLELEREIRERRRIEEELKGHRSQLEHLVDLRTCQITEANARLQGEIEERRRAEASIRQALEEKVVLLREIHHRVKNNLQIIASLLDMSRQRARSPEAAEQLSEAHAKVFTMALIHSQLYQSERFDEVGMERHVQELISHLSTLYEMSPPVTMTVHVSDIRLPVTQAIPCALVLNEIISNAFKHAFDHRHGGSIFVTMESDADSGIRLQVRDDGKGIPEDIDIDRTQSLGLKLVRNLVLHQLQGELHIRRQGGTVVDIQFRIPEGKDSHA